MPQSLVMRPLMLVNMESEGLWSIPPNHRAKSQLALSMTPASWTLLKMNRLLLPSLHHWMRAPKSVMYSKDGLFHQPLPITNSTCRAMTIASSSLDRLPVLVTTPPMFKISLKSTNGLSGGTTGRLTIPTDQAPGWP